MALREDIITVYLSIEDKTIEDILIRHPIHYVPAIMHRDASYSSFTVLVRY